MTDETKIEQEQPEPRGKITVRAVITRVDGTVEDLGIISEGTTDWTAGA